MKLTDDLKAVKAAYLAGDYLTALDCAFDVGKDGVALARLLTGGGLMKSAGAPSDAELAECLALCDEITAHHAKASAAPDASASPIWGKVFAIVDVVMSILKDLLAGGGA